MRKVAFIPARSGSKRIIDKNVRIFFGHPLMAYAIHSALQSEVFDEVICVTDSPRYANLAKIYGATRVLIRPASTASDDSPDVSWVKWALEELRSQGADFEVFSILRPTSPFRSCDTIVRAWAEFSACQPADSLRAVRKCIEHPGKMWVIQDTQMTPLLPFEIGGVPWHSNQYSALPEIFVQDASLEIAWTKTVTEKSSISGEIIIPFISAGFEGFDINTPEDWERAVQLVVANHVQVAHINS
jgi:CMP-N,N'-diacetyllegionaminic acid synthase